MFSAIKEAFSKGYMDLQLKTANGLKTRIVERPGRWMNEADLERLRQDLVSVASKTLESGTLTYGVFAKDANALRDTVITLISDPATNEPVAFNALAIMEVDRNPESTTILHLGLVMVDPNVQSRGLSWVLYGLTCILFFLRNQLRPIWISNVTQVPAIVGMVAETFSNVYPTPGSKNRRTIKHLLLARQIMQNHRHVFGVGDDAAFDEQRFVITNAYTGGSDHLKKSYEIAQKHRNETYNRFCASELDYDRGDDILQLGQIDLKTMKTYLLKSVPRGSILTLIVAGGFAILQRLALPVVYWFDSSRSWGKLRARNT